MKDEYDFSKAEKGKFYKKDAQLKFPIYLDHELQSRLQEIAIKKGQTLSELVNEVLQKDLDIVEHLS